MKEIKVKGMTCQHCQASVSEAVQKVDGVKDVTVDLASGLVTYAGPDGSEAAIKDNIEKIGFEVAD